MNATLTPIGSIETPYTTLEQCPRNTEPDGPLCKLQLHAELSEALLGLEAGRDILILYWFEHVDRTRRRQTSRKSGEYAGIFALRTPNRPNPIGAAVVRIEKIEGTTIYVRGLDCLSGTPLLDIKPARQGEDTAGENVRA
ncbi:MAG: tRNA (N6-threonylcarbamoyladenosine(37)-N6)-methyltransferase TrmO [Desulfuromonas sp.]|nr:MAG: tRNA (N6-threonylcarbamoyladenosine(37)-N6)-methyltransferase TrmO [Desulfuromonas sp.]